MDEKTREALGHMISLVRGERPCPECSSALAHLQAMAEENERRKEAHKAAAGRVVELLDEKIALKAEVERWKDEAKAIEVLMLMADGDRTIFKARAEKAEADRNYWEREQANENRRWRQAEADLAALRSAAKVLVNECEAEFTLDGYWNSDGALVKRKTVTNVKAALS